MYVCMHRMGVPLRHTSVPMLGPRVVGAAPISCSTYVFTGSVTHAFRIVCSCVWRFTFMFVILKAICSPAIVFIVFS